MGDLASLVLLNGRLRNKSHKQTIVVGGGDEDDNDVVNDVEGIDDTQTIKLVKRTMDPEQLGHAAKRRKP